RRESGVFSGSRDSHLMRKIVGIFSSWEVLFVSGLTFMMAVLYFVGVPFFDHIELKSWDLHFKYRGPIDASGPVAYVTIDEESVNREGRWPWPRRVMARLLKSVDEAGALVIGQDFGYFEPDLKLRRQAILDLRDTLGDGPNPVSKD